MNRRSAGVLTFLALAFWGFLVGCGDHGPLGPYVPGDALPDFSLLDVNPKSPSNGQAVSPRRELGKISAWYFGHAT